MKLLTIITLLAFMSCSEKMPKQVTQFYCTIVDSATNKLIAEVVGTPYKSEITDSLSYIRFVNSNDSLYTYHYNGFVITLTKITHLTKEKSL